MDESEGGVGEKIDRKYDSESERIIKVIARKRKRKSCRAVATMGMTVVASIGRSISKVAMALLVLSTILAV